nr:HEPN family nuclease [Desulfovibrio sp. JC010]
MLQEYARRTRKNMDYVVASKVSYDRDVYEITQIINSLLGLVVFQYEDFNELIDDTPLAGLDPRIWPECVRNFGPEGFSLRDFLFCFRNALAHSDIELIGNSGVIAGVKFGLNNCWKLPADPWYISLTGNELRQFVESLSDVLSSISDDTNFRVR